MAHSDKPTSKFYGLFQYVFDHYNQHLFDGEIKDCVIVVTRRKNVFGHYSPKRWFSAQDYETDELALNPAMFVKFPLIEICQTIVHEMCHGWQYHYGKPSQPGYHNKEWAAKMQEIGLMPSRTGKPGGKIVGQNMGDYPMAGGRFLEVSEELMNNEIFAGLYLEVNPEIVGLLNDDSPIFEQIKDLISTHVAAKPKVPMKSKYSCSCSNVWGSPNLDISCNRCETNMVKNI